MFASSTQMTYWRFGALVLHLTCVMGLTTHSIMYNITKYEVQTIKVQTLDSFTTQNVSQYSKPGWLSEKALIVIQHLYHKRHRQKGAQMLKVANSWSCSFQAVTQTVNVGLHCGNVPPRATKTSGTKRSQLFTPHLSIWFSPKPWKMFKMMTVEEDRQTERCREINGKAERKRSVEWLGDVNNQPWAQYMFSHDRNWVRQRESWIITLTGHDPNQERSLQYLETQRDDKAIWTWMEIYISYTWAEFMTLT